MSESLAWIGAVVHGATSWPCIDFVNTIEWRRSDRNEFLRDYADLVRWARHDCLLGEQEARRLLAAAMDRPTEAASAHEAAVTLREALYGVFAAVAAGAEAPTAELDVLNAALDRAAVPERLTATPAGFVRERLDPAADLSWPLNPVARSAADLLTGAELDRLKECPGGPNQACGFIFLDETKNRSRRWCSGRTCGNRVRLSRYYARQVPGLSQPRAD